RGAVLPHRAADGRAAAGRARGPAARGDRASLGTAGVERAAGRDVLRQRRRGGAGRARGGRGRPRPLLAAAPLTRRAHAGEHGRRRRGRARAAGAGGLRVQARRRAHPAPQGRRRGARVHPPSPGRDRAGARGRRLRAGAVLPRIHTGAADEAARFFGQALAEGHEGLMAKSLTAPYAAGHRGFHWLKLKSAHTLDLVVLAVEHGSGRRRGWLSNLHLGARDPETGQFVMLGKTFKGLTDEMLRWQTEKLLSLEVSRDEFTVYVRPELVAEIA